MGLLGTNLTRGHIAEMYCIPTQSGQPKLEFFTSPSSLILIPFDMLDYEISGRSHGPIPSLVKYWHPAVRMGL